jgi:drug/metabolite transporter (DMT)-like permease
MVAVSGLCFGLLSVFSRHLHEAGVPVPQMLALRFGFGAVALWGFAFARGEVRRLSFAQWRGYGLLGVLYVLEAWSYFESSQRIPIALTALLLYLFPSLVTLGAWVLWRQRPGARGLFALALASAGIALAVGNPSGALDGAGLGFGVVTAFVYTAYVLVSARLAPDVPPALGSAWLMTVAAGLFVGVASLGGPWQLAAALGAWPDVLGLVVVGTVVPIPLLLMGVARVGPARASVISTLEPISAAFAGALFLHEGLAPLQVVGAGGVVAAVLLSAKR